MSGESFGGNVAAFYERFMVPMVFEPYAEDLATWLTASHMGRVLETAAGTGIVTRKLAADLAAARDGIVATDISQPMIDLGREICPSDDIEWRQAAAEVLPFGDGTFDLVLCQFGVMFFKDRAKAYREALRVLKPGGRFVFNTWDRIEENDFVQTASEAVASLFSGDPPDFMARVPHGYHDRPKIASDLAEAGFTNPVTLEIVSKTRRAPSAGVAARAYVQGTPLRGEIEKRDAARLPAAVAAAENALARRFGRGSIEGRMRAYLVSVSV